MLGFFPFGDHAFELFFSLCSNRYPFLCLDSYQLSFKQSFKITIDRGFLHDEHVREIYLLRSSHLVSDHQNRVLTDTDIEGSKVLSIYSIHYSLTGIDSSCGT